jgi:hypothetical protein
MAAPFPLCISKFRNYGSGSLIRDSCLCEEAESGSTLRISGREKHFRSVAYRRLQCCASAFFPAGTDAFELAASVGPEIVDWDRAIGNFTESVCEIHNEDDSNWDYRGCFHAASTVH